MNITPAKVASVRQTIETTAAKPLYLTTYSPDLDPIEPTFANIKAPVRKTADEPSMATGNGFSISSRQTNVETTSLRRRMDQPDLTSLYMFDEESWDEWYRVRLWWCPCFWRSLPNPQRIDHREPVSGKWLQRSTF